MNHKYFRFLGLLILIHMLDSPVSGVPFRRGRVTLVSTHVKFKTPSEFIENVTSCQNHHLHENFPSPSISLPRGHSSLPHRHCTPGTQPERSSRVELFGLNGSRGTVCLSSGERHGNLQMYRTFLTNVWKFIWEPIADTKGP